MLTAAAQAADAPADVVHIPDDAGAAWYQGASARQRPGWEAQAERAIRRFVLPGHVGMMWSRTVARRCAEMAARKPSVRTVLLTTYPPVGTHLAGVQAAGANVRWIADFRDPMGVDTVNTGLPAIMRATLRRIERTTIRRSSAIVLNADSARELYSHAYPAAARKMHTIWNGFDPEQRIAAAPIPPRGYRVIIHAGSMYGGRNANLVVQSMSRLRTAGMLPPIRLHLVGGIGFASGVEEDLYRRGVEEGWLQLDTKGVPRPVAEQMVSEADGLLLLQPQSSVQVPAKLFEYLSIGRPILAVAPSGSAIEWILSRAGVPRVCLYPNDTPAAVDEKVRHYLEIPNQPVRASEWFEETFDASRQTQQLAAIIERL